jgi:hypothetical protein
MANGMVEMERHASAVYIPPGAPTKLRRLEMRLLLEDAVDNPGMIGSQTREIKTIFASASSLKMKNNRIL